MNRWIPVALMAIGLIAVVIFPHYAAWIGVTLFAIGLLAALYSSIRYLVVEGK